jgi:hypothetical protein
VSNNLERSDKELIEVIEFKNVHDKDRKEMKVIITIVVYFYLTQ